MEKRMKIKLFRSIGFLILSICITGCAGISRNVSNLLFPPVPSSDQRKGEDVKLVLKNQFGEEDGAINNCQKEEGEAEPYFAFAAPAASVLADIAYKQVQKMLEEEAKRYTATYSAATFGDKFYYNICKENVPVESKIFLDTITLTRTIANYDSPAMKLVMQIHPLADGTAFRIQPVSLVLNKSKAKVAAFDFTRPLGFDLLAPWTILQINSFSDLSPIRDAKIDMTIDITIHAVWSDKEGIGQSKDVATKQIKLRNVEIGKTKTFNEGDSELFPAIPRSVKYMKEKPELKDLGYGNFVVSILVTEHDSYGERVTELKQKLESNQDFLRKLIPE